MTERLRMKAPGGGATHYEYIDGICQLNGCVPVDEPTVGAVSVTVEPTVPDNYEMFVPIPTAREYKQMREALRSLIAATENIDPTDFNDEVAAGDFREALGFATATLALVEPVEV